MGTWQRLLAFGLIWNVACVSAYAHPGHATDQEESGSVSGRTWTDKAGAFHLHGSFVAVKAGKVQIRRQDDSLVTLEVDRLSPDDRAWIDARAARIAAGNRQLLKREPSVNAVLVSTKATPPAIAKAFSAFVKTKEIQTRWDDRFFYVESRGIPAHPMMVGIRAWQQQVPIPQSYFGDNAWRIPLTPIPAKDPRTANGEFLRGAIALAVNGIPIFNPLNNRGDDAYLFGELDEYGGHCGRADDYHYHIAPVHLQKIVGPETPIAYALDGYPIFGVTEPDGSPVKGLDEFNGHEDASVNYHYHASKKYPYVNGGFHGEVTERDGQVDPQPRANPLRPALPPLRGAKIVGCEATKPNGYRVTYEVGNRQGSVAYMLAEDGSARFEFVEPGGRTTTETYSPRRRGPGRPEGPPPRDEGRLPRNKVRPPREEGGLSRTSRSTSTIAETRRVPTLEVSSSSVDDHGRIDVDCTCDGAGQTPDVSWKGAPAGAQFFALSLWHTAPDQEKSYWLVYNIPGDLTSLSRDARQVGKWGLNDKRRTDYDPMCSKGPGVKTYHLTVYALADPVMLDSRQATRAGLLNAIKDITLAEGTLDFTYERSR